MRLEYLSSQSAFGDFVQILKTGTAQLLSAGDRAQAGFWRWTLSVAAVIVTVFIIAMFGELVLKPLLHAGALSDLLASVADEKRRFTIARTLHWFSLLGLFVLVVAVGLRVVRLRLSNIIAPLSKVQWRLSGIVAVPVFLLVTCSSLLEIWQRGEAEEVSFLPLTGWSALFIPIMFGLVIFQASAEELVFRGYLLQLLGRICRSWLVISLVVGGLFFAIHLPSTLFDALGWLAYLQYVLLAAMLTVTAQITGRLEYSIGAHIGWNWSILVVDFDIPSIPDRYFGIGAIVYSGSIEPNVASAIAFFLTTLIVFLICLTVHYRYVEAENA